jgi:hypothetical protein
MQHLTGARLAKHDAIREGMRLGLSVATSIWIWIAAVDAIAGEPFRTFNVLGGIIPFTVLHYLLNVVYGTAIVAAIHRAIREPGLVGVVAFGFVLVEAAFAMGTVLLSHLGLGELAWLRIFGGSVIGALVAIVMLARQHPLAATLRQADTEDRDV